MLPGLLLAMGLAAADPGLGAYRFDLEGGLGAAAGAPSPYGAGSPTAYGYGLGAVIVHGDRWGLEVAAREGPAYPDLRAVGALFLGARWSFSGTAFARLGLAHNHEVPQAVVEAYPFQSSIGSAPGIRHRTGAELGIGWRLPLEDALLKDRPSLSLQASLSAFPDAQGPAIYAFMDANVLIAVGARRH